MIKSNFNNTIILKEMRKDDLYEFLLKVNKTPLLYRVKLNLPDFYSFGNEIEFNGCSHYVSRDICDVVNSKYNYKIDGLYEIKPEQTTDAEIATPLLINNEISWESLGDVYELLNSSGALIGENTASHIHVGSHIISSYHELSLLLKTFVVFEPIIFKFGYGIGNSPREFIRYREKSVNYSMIMTPKRVNKLVGALDNSSIFPNYILTSYFKSFLTDNLKFRPVFNFNNFCFSKLQYERDLMLPQKDDNIEVRCFNGTLSKEICQNNINLILHILYAVSNGQIDEDYVNAEYKKYCMNKYNFDAYYGIIIAGGLGEEYNNILDSYSKVDMEKAIKLADMIFDTEIDKMYFMKQYLKLFNLENNKVRSLVI